MVLSRSNRRFFVILPLLFLGLAAVVAGLLLVARTAEADASLLTVTNTNDDGPGSLRQVIAAAGPGDTAPLARPRVLPYS